MARSRVAATLRSSLFNTSSVICLSKARHLLLPIVAGAAFAIGGTAFTSDALAAVGVCAPDGNGTPAATGPIESCSGDFATGISYPGALGTGGNFEVDLNSVTNTADGGVIVSGGGAVNVTVTQFAVAGNITNLAGNGIEATNFGGNIAITTVVGGNVTASGIGVYGEQLLAAGSGSVTISVAGNISGGVAGAGAGIVGQVQGDIGNVSITTAANTVISANGYTALVDSNVAIYASAPDGDANEIAGNVTVSLGNFTAVTLTNAANGAGISADTFGDSGNVNVTLGNGATITLNDGTGNDASGIYAVAQDGGNLVTGNVAVTLNDSALNHAAITVSGDNNTAITARNEGSGSVTINTGANNDFVLTGDRSLGIYTTGASNGSINVTTGVGSDITVNAGDGNVTPVYAVSAGIYASGNGGNVGVNTGGNVTVNGFSAPSNLTVGILAYTTGTGEVSVTATGGVTSQWGPGIDAVSGDGNVTVTSSGTVSVGGFAIRALSVGNGTATVSNSGNIVLAGTGIIAASSGGDVRVDNSGNILANTNAIYAQTSGGDITVGNNAFITGNLSGATNAGIETVNTTGNTLIQNSSMASLGTAQYGIKASSTTGSIVIVNSIANIGSGGAGNGVDLAGIDAVSSGANAGQIDITNYGSNIYVDDQAGLQFGIRAANTGVGPIQITNYAGSNISGADYGIAALGAGHVYVDSASGSITASVDYIYAESTGSGNVIVGYGGFIDGVFAGATNSGIEAISTTGVVTVSTTADMSALSGAAYGIKVSSTTGGIVIDSRGQIGAAGPGNGVDTAGISAVSNGLNAAGIGIGSHAAIYADNTPGTSGINAFNSGSGAIQIVNNADIAQPADGIDAIGNGNVSVTNDAANISATTIGVKALSGPGAQVSVLMNMSTSISGNVTTFNNPNITVTAGTHGISAQSLAGGNVLVSGTGRDLTGNGTSGDDGLAGNVSLTDGLLSANLTAHGIFASTSGNGTATIRLAAANAGNATFGASTRGAVTVDSADFAAAISAATQSGNITIALLDNTVAGSSIAVTSSAGGAGNAGISANATAPGNATVSGSVVINTGNFNNVSVSGDNSVGILGQSSFGNVTITTGTNSSLTVAANSSGGNESGYSSSYGIVAGVTNAGATGNVTVNSNAVVTVTNNAASSTIGINATNSGTGTLSVFANAAITSNGGSAIRTVGGAGPVTINNNVLIRGLGASAGTAVVNVSSSVVGNTSAATITINNNATGVIASVGGVAADFAIGATTPGTGTVNVFNTGRITGAVDVLGAAGFAFNNSSATSWHTSGNNTFTNGYDAINNFGSGRLATNGPTTFNFQGNAYVNIGNVSVPIIDDFINSATLIVGETSGPSSLTITKSSGPLKISNSGTIILGGQSTGLNTDGQTNDQLLAKDGNITFAASGNSRLKIDAFLGAGAEAQSSANTGCALTAAFADCMSIGASTVATGSVGTRVSINDTNSAGGGAINLPGTVIVDGISGSAGDFFLSTADTNVVNTAQGLAIRKGFVLYQLIFDPTNVDWDLVGMPAAEIFELSKVTAGLQTVWHETADGWNERTSAIRHDFAADTMVRAWTIWGKAYYGQADRDSENTIDAAGNSFTFDTTYSQSYGGIQFGADVSRRTANGAWAVGGLFGYNKTRVEFDASSDAIDGTVINVGAYGSFMAGPFFADVLVKDDIATLDFDLPAYAGVDNVDANSIGAELTFGGRFGRRIVFEPLGTLAYVKTAVGNLDSAGMNFNWEDGTSFRGIFALRLSGEFGPDQTRLQPFVLGGIGREFDGENNLLLSSGGSSFSIMDKPIETFGVASLGLNVLGTSGWSGFIRADGLFAPDYHSAAIRVGMRIR